MYSMKLAVVIPSHQEDLDRIPRMLKSIEAQTRLPDLVILRISSVEQEPIIESAALFPLVILWTPERQSAAQNRNLAALSAPAGTDLISFFDSDDWMHPQRLEYVVKAFENPVDVVLHNALLQREEEFEGWPPVTYSFHSSCCFIENNRCYIQIPAGRRMHASGHVSLRRAVLDEVVFPGAKSTIGFEDTLFLASVYHLGFRLGYLDSQLSLYMQFPPETRLEKDYNLQLLRG